MKKKKLKKLWQSLMDKFKSFDIIVLKENDEIFKQWCLSQNYIYNRLEIYCNYKIIYEVAKNRELLNIHQEER